MPATAAATHRLQEPDVLRRYADAIVRSCLLLEEGDQLFILAEPAHRELIVALADSAYRTGVHLVDTRIVDPLVKRVRVQHAPDEALGNTPLWQRRWFEASGGARNALIQIAGEEEPSLLADLPADRLVLDARRHRMALRPWVRNMVAGRVRFCIPAWPTAGWAKLVYPDVAADEALRRLADDLLLFCRMGPDDAASAWDEHTAELRRRADAINARDFARLELKGPGVDLTVSFVSGTRWGAANDENAYGQAACSNFPTEEVFTTPDARRTEGTWACSRPLAYSGRMIEGLRGEFRGGRLVRLEADDESDRDVLAGALDGDPGGRRLGEVALLDSASRIGATGRTYGMTLLDENAATHIAFGAGFPDTRPAGTSRAGVNRSSTHIDVMIGSDELEAVGVERGGARVPVVADGSWQLS